MPRKTDACVFCGARPTTNEDVIPRWLARRVRPTVPATRRTFVTYKDRTDLAAPTPKSVNSIELGKIKAVCAMTCNNGWMKRLEDDTKPILLSLFSGTAILDVDQQATLAMWAAKTGMMAALKFDKEPEPSLFDAMFKTQGPPKYTNVWLSLIHPPAVRIELSQVLSHPNRDRSIALKGNVASLVFANVGLLIYCTPLPIGMRFQGDALERAIQPVWPIESVHLDWPAPAITDDAFGRLGLAARDVLMKGEPLPPAPTENVLTGRQVDGSSEDVAEPPSESEP